MVRSLIYSGKQLTRPGPHFKYERATATRRWFLNITLPPHHSNMVLPFMKTCGLTGNWIFTSDDSQREIFFCQREIYFARRKYFFVREKYILDISDKVFPIHVQWVLFKMSDKLGASLRSSNSVLVVRLVAIGGHQSAVEGVHPSALVVPNPEPEKDWVFDNAILSQENGDF